MIRNNTYSCSNCQAIYTIKSMNAKLLVCVKCNDVIQDLTNQKLIRKVFPDDWSYIKIGTKGIANKKQFEVIGRVKLQLFNSYKNAWYILFDDGLTSWLMDDVGKLSIAQHATKDIDFDTIYQLVPGKKVKLKNLTCTLYSMEECEQVYYEGEIGAWAYYSRGFFLAEGVLSNQGTVLFFLNIPKKEIHCMDTASIGFENLNPSTITQWDEWK